MEWCREPKVLYIGLILVHSSVILSSFIIEDYPGSYVIKNVLITLGVLGILINYRSSKCYTNGRIIANKVLRHMLLLIASSTVISLAAVLSLIFGSLGYLIHALMLILAVTCLLYALALYKWSMQAMSNYVKYCRAKTIASRGISSRG